MQYDIRESIAFFYIILVVIGDGFTMDYDFAVDNTKIGELISTLNQKIGEINEMIKNLFDEGEMAINNLADSEIWNGNSYRTFKNGTEQNALFVRQNLEKAVEVLGNYVKVLSATMTAARQITQDYNRYMV